VLTLSGKPPGCF